jgi:hypothetical protein
LVPLFLLSTSGIVVLNVDEAFSNLDGRRGRFNFDEMAFDGELEQLRRAFVAAHAVGRRDQVPQRQGARI